ncbi:hypothetical protein LTR16_012720, partial [Cryomyces antarcticus]
TTSAARSAARRTLRSRTSSATCPSLRSRMRRTRTERRDGCSATGRPTIRTMI